MGSAAGTVSPALQKEEKKKFIPTDSENVAGYRK